MKCPFNLECKVVQEVQLGEYILLMGKIVETHIDEDKVEFVNKHPQINIAKVNPLVYCSTVREYWGLGKNLEMHFNRAGIY